MKPQKNQLRTPKQAHEWLREQGKTARWVAKQLKTHPSNVYDVLYGRNKGTFGAGFQVAVFLGIKPTP